MKYGLCLIALLAFTAFAAQPVPAQPHGKSFKRAERAIRDGNFEEAEKIFRQLVEHDQADNNARLGLSFVLIKQVRLQSAYEEAARVVVVDPLNARAHALMGTSMLRSGEFRESIESLYTAVKFNPREALAWAGLSEIFYFENHARNAYEGLKRAIQLDPNEPDYYISLARSCSKLEYYIEAADAYQRFLEVAPRTDAERRARIRGLIDFYRYLGSTKIHRTGGQVVSTAPFELIEMRDFSVFVDRSRVV